MVQQKNHSIKIQTPQFKRKFPRRKFSGYVGVLYRGQFQICEGAVIGEGGLAFHREIEIPLGGWVVVSFRVPGFSVVSVRGEVRNVRPLEKTLNGSQIFHGMQFFSLPIEERRKIRGYVSARLQDEELV